MSECTKSTENEKVEFTQVEFYKALYSKLFPSLYFLLFSILNNCKVYFEYNKVCTLS